MSGCAQVNETASSSSPPGSQQKKSVLPIVEPSYPGPYKTVTIDGAEMRQGRFPVGEFGGNFIKSIVGGDPKVFNPWSSSDGTSSQLAGLMFASLVAVDPYTGKVIPDMAASYEVKPDGITYYTKLRKGLKWSDGKPITAEDVAFTWNTIIKGGYGNSSLRDVTTINGKSPSVTVVDELTNKYVTPKPFAPFVRLLGMTIAPKHVIEPIINGKDGRNAFQQLWSANVDPKSLVTSGPFVLSRYVPSQRVEFIPSKNYYAANADGKRLPYLSRMTYVILPDVNTNLLKFKAKEIDETQVRLRDVPEFLASRQKENFQLYNLGPSMGTTFIMFNLNRRKNPDTHNPYVDPVKSAWFNNVDFRQAINHALNRDAMVANYFKGLGAPLFTAEPQVSPYFNSNLPSFKQDLKLASLLLEKSGFKKKPDGYLYDAKGNKVEFNLLTSAGSTYYETVGNMIANDLSKLGIKVNFQQVNGNMLLDKTETSLDWDCVLMSLAPGDPLEPNDGANVWKSTGRLHLFDQRLPNESGNIVVTDARPWEVELDRIFNEGAQTLDLAKRHELYNAYQKIIYNQAPFVYLVTPLDIIAIRNTLHNYQPTKLSQGSEGLHNLEEMWKK
jgi:peptide/nickel transport system substrate-binding protein